MSTTNLSNQDTFDLPAFLLGEVYGREHEEGQRLHWALADAINLAEDMKRYDGIDVDPQEIYEIMMEFDAQDAAEEAAQL
ncbi:MAG: hypothetical protein J6A79_13945 [Clostridia bacterium]|nr:hypothetical protein [Clostridia bacterium]